MSIGVDASGIDDLVSILACILHLGNVVTITDNKTSVDLAAAALSVDPTALWGRLTKRRFALVEQPPFYHTGFPTLVTMRATPFYHTDFPTLVTMTKILITLLSTYGAS
jgi:hypothetical protein